MDVNTILDKSAFIGLSIVIILMPLIGHAGGLGVAPLVFILGILGFFLMLKNKTLKITPVFISLAVFLIWLCISAIWSPYRPDDLFTNYIKLFIMVLVVYFSTPVFSYVNAARPLIVRHLVMATSLIGAGVLLIDLLTGYGLTLIFTDEVRPSGASHPLADAEMNVGHGITILVLLSAPVAFLMQSHLKWGWAVAVMFLGLIPVISWLGGLSVGVLGVAAVLLTGALAYIFPKFFPKALLVTIAMLILVAPLIAYGADKVMMNGGLDIPLSWEHRLRMWAYCWPVITEAPIWGVGFDGSRTFTETFLAPDGRNITIVSLHPHNAGIQIWTETGAIGAILSVIVLFSLLKPLQNYIENRGRDAAAAAAGVMSAAAIISSLTYGSWQFWWWGSVVFAIGLLHLLPDSVTEKGRVD